jgi:cystathionine gamma-synthase
MFIMFCLLCDTVYAQMTVIRPADMDALQNALDSNNVSLFFTETPTNPFLRCIDVELVANMCHSKGALLCIDSTFASPINQKALTLGADLVIHSATKYIAGHNDVIGGCVSGRDELVSKVRIYHHVVGGVLNPNAAYLILRGMKTLHLRVQCQNNTALRMAQFLEEHPKVWIFFLLFVVQAAEY